MAHGRPSVAVRHVTRAATEDRPYRNLPRDFRNLLRARQGTGVAIPAPAGADAAEPGVGANPVFALGEHRVRPYGSAGWGRADTRRLI